MCFSEAKAGWSLSLHRETTRGPLMLAAPFFLITLPLPPSQTFCPHILVLGSVLEKTLIKTR